MIDADRLITEDRMANFIILRRIPRNQAAALGRELEREWDHRWGRSSAPIWRPNADIHEHQSEYLIKIELAGMRDAEVEVTMADGQLIVRGQRIEQRHGPVESVHELGINYGPFQLEFALNVPLSEDEISARYDDGNDGLLYITLPKQAQKAAQPRRITIQVDESKLTPQ
jgi:HSP20 family protein